jgi:serine/threonine protein kinase
VAVKLIRSELAGEKDFRARFAREVRAASRVSGVFTAPVIDADPDAPQPWLVTGYIEGPSLGDAVSTHGPMSADAVAALAAGLAEGLEAIHAAGIVHRDLKPSNVVLADDGPRIIDFGIARAADTTWRTGPAHVIGSPGFMSPEQAEGRECGPPSDIFSLGALLTYAVTGEGPFGSGPAEALLYRVVHGQPATSRIPAQLRPIIESCLVKDPRRRPTTSGILADIDLLRSRTQRPLAHSTPKNAETLNTTVNLPENTFPHVQPSPAIRRQKPFAGRKWLLTLCSALVLAGAIAIGFIAFSGTHMGATPASAASTSGTGPAMVVRAFFTAISNHDWQQVWSLGGKNLNRRPPYNTLSGMAEGYRCTVNDEIKTISASGQTVSGRFVAHEARNGVRTEQTFRFSYLVSGNEIRSGRQHLLAGKAPPGCA